MVMKLSPPLHQIMRPILSGNVTYILAADIDLKYLLVFESITIVFPCFPLQLKDRMESEGHLGYQLTLAYKPHLRTVR